MAKLGGTCLYLGVFTLAELLPLWPVTTKAWLAISGICTLLGYGMWMHEEFFGMPDEDHPSFWKHILPWAVILLLLFFGQDLWWPEFMERNFIRLWNW